MGRGQIDGRAWRQGGQGETSGAQAGRRREGERLERRGRRGAIGVDKED